MAKRKRLTPPNPATTHSPSGPLETKAFGGAPMRAPIADVAGDAATRAALDEVANAMETARADERLIQLIPLSSIAADHLVRDRLSADPDELAALKSSIAARGQQTPADLERLGPGRFGLISGWRRLLALQELYAETGDEKFSRLRALIRKPDAAPDAYLAMIEENEIRAGLSYYERARIAARAAGQGAFATDKIAVRTLFATASRAKRSKINGFLAIYHALDDVLRFPAALPERLGLRLAKAVEDTSLLAQLRTTAGQASTAEEELRLLTEALSPKQPKGQGGVTTSSAPPKTGFAPHGVIEQTITDTGDITLSGSGLTEAFRRDLQRLIKRHT